MKAENMTDERYDEEARRENLEKLATYLENLPENYEHFNMHSFIDHKSDFQALVDYALNNGGVHNCGTAACAVGHGPAAGILFHEDELTIEEVYSNISRRWIKDVLMPDWTKYSERFVECLDSDAFEFLFSASWILSDNTVAGAAKRIRYYLENGIPDEFFDADGVHVFEKSIIE